MADDAAASLPPISLSVLQVVRPAQAQNGLKHGDYQRYRKFCGKRLGSLYKSLKFTHGKGRYQKRKLEPATVTDPRHLHIPLLSAERAWAYAMELKKDMADKVDLRVRRHLIRRLVKAAGWAAELAMLSRERCDARSSLEAEAYSSWMEGNVLLEKETEWEVALGHFTKAKTLFGELSKVGEMEQQTHCSQMLEEIEPSIRYCNYQISRKGGKVPDLAELLSLGNQEGRGLDMLQGKLAALAEQAASAEASTTSAVIEWQGRRCPVRHERVRLCLHQAAELAAQIAGAMEDDGAGDERLARYDKMINAYNDAKSHIRSALQAAAGTEGGGQLEELQALDMAVSGTALERTIERGEVMATVAAGRYAASLQRAAQGKKAKDKERYSRPEDVVRLYDNLQRHAEELGDLAQRLGGRQGEALIEASAAKVSRYQAWRCYFMAHTYLAGAKLPEAHALFARAAERAAAAAAKQQELAAPDAVALSELEQLSTAASGYRLVAQVEVAAEAERSEQGAVEGVDKLTLREVDAGATPREPFLLDALQRFESFAGQNGKDVRVYEAPYPLQPIAVRPIMLDTAFSAIKYPPLDHRVKKAEKKSLLGRLFGY